MRFTNSMSFYRFIRYIIYKFRTNNRCYKVTAYSINKLVSKNRICRIRNMTGKITDKILRVFTRDLLISLCRMLGCKCLLRTLLSGLQATVNSKSLLQTLPRGLQSTLNFKCLLGKQVLLSETGLQAT